MLNLKRAAGAVVAIGLLAVPATAQTPNSDPENPFGQPRRYQPNNPGTNPGPGPAPRPFPPGGYVKPGNSPNYSSISEYMLGVWEWRNNQGRVYRAAFQRSGRMVAGAPGTGFVMAGIWRAQGRLLQMKFLRRCQIRGQQSCRPAQNQRVFSIRLQPVSRTQLRTNIGAWRRIR